MISNRFYCYYYSDTPNAMVTGELDKIMSVSCPNCNGRIEACRRTDGRISTTSARTIVTSDNGKTVARSVSVATSQPLVSSSVTPPASMASRRLRRLDHHGTSHCFCYQRPAVRRHRKQTNQHPSTFTPCWKDNASKIG